MFLVPVVLVLMWSSILCCFRSIEICGSQGV
ncbi:hypothetical protein A2U01_0117064, partial [Trifolium medium]|nr:hypothetical protein [Trifolium medium]